MLRFSNFYSCVTRRFVSVKCKTNKAVAKRFKRLPDDTFSYAKAGQNHNFAKKSCRARTDIRAGGTTAECAFQTNLLSRLCPYKL